LNFVGGGLIFIGMLNAFSSIWGTPVMFMTDDEARQMLTSGSSFSKSGPRRSNIPKDPGLRLPPLFFLFPFHQANAASRYRPLGGRRKPLRYCPHS
jgi:hypothetical protein